MTVAELYIVFFVPAHVLYSILQINLKRWVITGSVLIFEKTTALCRRDLIWKANHWVYFPAGCSPAVYRSILSYNPMCIKTPLFGTKQKQMKNVTGGNTEQFMWACSCLVCWYLWLQVHATCGAEINNLNFCITIGFSSIYYEMFPQYLKLFLRMIHQRCCQCVNDLDGLIIE